MASSGKVSEIRDTLRYDIKIFVKDVRDRHGKKRPLTVRTWSTVKDVKDQLQQLIHIPPSNQRLYFGPLLVSAKELPNHRTLHDAGVYRSGATLLLDIVGNAIDDQVSITSLSKSAVSDICVSSSMLDSTPKPMIRIIQQARRGLALGLKPELVLEGSGGTYFLHDARKVKVAVFKPADEEPYAENNPRGYVKQGAVLSSDHDSLFSSTSPDTGELSLREGIRPGESCLREVAAYLIDHGGFSSVPMTTLTDARHPAFNMNGARLKLAEGGAAMGSHALNSSVNAVSQMTKKVGSCQEFVNAECSMDDLSPSKLDVDEVHKIAILDIRIMNADRNAANLLCRRRTDNTLELVPIDHGFCLRAAADVAWFDWCWLDWPQLKKPLSQKSKDYILNLDIEADICLLEENLRIGKEALDYFRASSQLLQMGVKMGLSLYDIASICSRQDSAGLDPSKLEKIYLQARELSTSAIENGRWHHAAASRALANQLATDVTGPEVTGKLVHRSQSTISFSSYLISQESLVPPPSAMPMSGSDSSSDSGDQLLDQETDCEEWAANILADVEIDDGDRKRTRSMSSSGSDSDFLTGSPLGFWVVRPGADEDDDSWDSSSEEEESPPSSLSRRLSSLTLNEMDVRRPKSLIDANEEQRPHEFDLSPLSSTDLPKKPSGGMVRSQSYSAFSLMKSGASVQSSANLRRKGSAESEKSQEYFYKFINLLIERETKALLSSGTT